MSRDYLPDELKNLWQGLSVNPVPVSLGELRAEMGKLRKGLSRRLVLGGGAALIGVVVYVGFFFIFPNALERIGSVMTIVGAGYLIVQILLRRSRMTLDTPETECLRFYREELERQRDFHQGVWLWSRIALFCPGPLVFMVGFARLNPHHAPFIWFICATFLALSARGVLLNLRLAQKFQCRIDALDKSRRGE